MHMHILKKRSIVLLNMTLTREKMVLHKACTITHDGKSNLDPNNETITHVDDGQRAHDDPWKFRGGDI